MCGLSTFGSVKKSVCNFLEFIHFLKKKMQIVQHLYY